MTNIPNDFDERKWKDNLKEAYDRALRQKIAIKREIENLTRNMDVVELLSSVSLLSQFIPEGKPELNQDLRDEPILHFLAGLCLKTGKRGDRCPDNQEVARIMELLHEYFGYYSLDLIFQSGEGEQVSGADSLVLGARLQKIISQINPSVYQFQLEDLLGNVLGKFDDYFAAKVGFTVSDAFEFGQRILARYETLVNKRLDEARKAREEAKRDLGDPIKGPQLREALRKKNITEEEFIESYFGFLMFTSTRDIFVFTADEFCSDEDARETGKFRNYLKALSCGFGEENRDLDSPLDSNIILTKPIIDINGGKYFCPIPQDLIFNLPLIFESFLEEEKGSQTRIWQRYQKRKSQYAEDKVAEYLCRLFPKRNVYKNLKYTYQGQEFEVDILIPFDNKIFIIESKAGSFTERAKRGEVERLKTDLGKLIEEAYQQGRRVIDYIKSSETAIFKSKNGRTVLEIKFRVNNIDFFLINVTMEPLMILATGLKRLQSLGLFLMNEYPWSVNLFELDIITRHISSPTIFIHYLERRLAALDQNVFEAFDELSFLAWYLERGNFYVPSTPDGKIPDFVWLDASWVATFDDHYLYGSAAPKLKIEPDLVEIIRILEVLRPVGYSNMTSALLDLDHEARELLLKNMKKLIDSTNEDRGKHDFSVLTKDILDTGFTFMTQWGRSGLVERLGSYCVMKKYETKAKRWVGIGRDVSDDEWFVNEFVYLDFPWQNDREMDELISKYPFREREEKQN